MATFPRLAVEAWSCRVVAQAMARRNVRRSVWTKSRTDQVCGAKQRQGHAVYPALEQKAAIHFLCPFLVCRLPRAQGLTRLIHPFWCARWASKGDQRVGQFRL